MRIGITGSHGVIGKKLIKRFPKAVRLGRGGTRKKLDLIIDLATYGNLASHTGIKKIYEANLMRMIKITENNAKLIYVSTSSVNLPVQTIYSLSKKATEEFLKNTYKKLAIVRPYTIIGTGEQEEHLIPKLIDSCINGTKMPFVGEPVHDFVSHEDFIDAIELVIKKGKFKGEIYEVGSGTAISNKEIKDMVEEIAGRKANVKLVKSLRSYDTKSWVANPSLIKKLGWKPKDSVHCVIEEMYAEKNT